MSQTPPPQPEPTNAHRGRRRWWAAALAVPAAFALAANTATFEDDDKVAARPGPDPLRSEQWALDTLHLRDATTASAGCGTTIAVVDSGVDLDHPDLRDHLVPGIDLVDGDDEPDDENGHGTHVAGIAAAATDNSIGIAGAAPCARIMPVRVLGSDGSGDEETIAEGIRWAAAHGADVINLSLGESGFVARLRKGGALNAAIRDADDQGAVVVAAAGNEGTGHLATYRVTVPVILVGAIGPDEQPAEFSNFGDPRTLVAPGVGILSTVPEDGTEIFPDGTHGYAELDGTSMAAPYVSGVAALLAAQGRTPDEVAAILFDTARDGGDDVRIGAGIVDAAAAVTHEADA
jgi:subtilisin family serine protease